MTTRDRLVAFRIGDSLAKEYDSLKAKTKIEKDSVLLRAIFTCGLVTAQQLHKRGEFWIQDRKLRKILDNLKPECKAELLDMLKKELEE